MTRDAKIGLLLGLVFIFIIAFVINGLPSFSGQKNNNELTTNMVGLRNNPPAIGAKERKIINPVPIVQLEQSPPAASADDVRFDIALPKTHVAADKTNQVEPAAAAPSPPLAEENRSIEKEAGKAASPRIYAVNEGDSLATIARKFYGAEQGGKKASVDLIFQANRKVLKSPDEINIGQELVSPPPPVSGKNKSASVFSGPEFTQTDSVGKRHLLTGSEQPRQYKWHTVQDGENLWRIAAAELGDGSRYGEIVKLNGDVLKNEDSLEVGMRLKMPAR